MFFHVSAYANKSYPFFKISSTERGLSLITTTETITVPPCTRSIKLLREFFVVLCTLLSKSSSSLSCSRKFILEADVFLFHFWCWFWFLNFVSGRKVVAGSALRWL